jgi:hypothetical protein
MFQTDNTTSAHLSPKAGDDTHGRTDFISSSLPLSDNERTTVRVISMEMDEEELM